MQPPGSDSVNVAVLARLFANTTNSYKYLFALALLDSLERRYGDTQELLRIPLRELGIGMLLNACFQKPESASEAEGHNSPIDRRRQTLQPDAGTLSFTNLSHRKAGIVTP